MNVREVLFSAAASFLLVGCAAGPGDNFKYDDKHSYAWNLNKASAMGTFYDQEVVPGLIEFMESKPFYWGPTSDKNPLNLNNANLYPLLKTRFSVDFSGEDFLYNHALAWIPGDKAKDKQEAHEIFEQELDQAVRKAFRRAEVYSTHTAPSGPANAFSLGLVGTVSHSVNYVIWADDLGCSINTKRQAEPDACSVGFRMNGAESYSKTPSVIAQNPTGKSYIMGASFISVGTDMEIHDDPRKQRVILQRISEHLPPWIVFYSNQETKIGLPAVIMQQGKNHFYISENKE